MSSAIDRDVRAVSAFDVAHWLSLVTAPSLAIMALLTAKFSNGKAAMICGLAPEPSWLCGMVPMYLLMSLAHSPPWLRLIAGRRRFSSLRGSG
jgi:hypothetical protein